MIKQVWNWIIGKKEVKLDYPPEFAVIKYTDNALRNGIEDYSNKIIVRYKYNYRIGKISVYKTYGYSESTVYNLRNKFKIPIYDETELEEPYPIYEELNLNEVSYDKG